MKKTIALKENHEFRRLYHRGTSSAGRHLVLYCRKNRLGHNRLGLTVSAKLACAVKRNRIKRLFREAYRLHEDEFATGVDLVLVARARAVGATYQDIENRCCVRSARTKPQQLSREAVASGARAVLPEKYLSAQAALLPLYADLLAVRPRGDREVRRSEGRLACAEAHLPLPSLLQTRPL